MAKEYVVMSAQLACNKGTAPSKLVVLPQRTEQLNGNLLANKIDCKPYVNVMPFAMCTSKANPGVIANKGAPIPCTPTCSIWLGCKTDHLVDGIPALMNDDIAVCPLGAGKIEVKDSGQTGGQQANSPPRLDGLDSMILMASSGNERDTGLRDLSDEEVSRRARDRSLSGEERRRYQKEEKARGLRNKQKRQNKFSVNSDAAEAFFGLTGVALVIYLIISEGSRLFPLRNLIPIP